MIGQQAVTPNFHIKMFAPFSHQINIELIICKQHKILKMLGATNFSAMKMVSAINFFAWI